MKQKVTFMEALKDIIRSAKLNNVYKLKDVNYKHKATGEIEVRARIAGTHGYKFFSLKVLHARKIIPAVKGRLDMGIHRGEVG